MAMVRIENKSPRQYDINHNPTKKWDGGRLLVSVPRASEMDGSGKRKNGAAECDEDALLALLADDPWTKGVFDSGDLILAAPKPAPKAEENPEPKAPVGKK